MLLLLVE